MTPASRRPGAARANTPPVRHHLAAERAEPVEGAVMGRRRPSLPERSREADEQRPAADRGQRPRVSPTSTEVASAGLDRGLVALGERLIALGVGAHPAL